MQASSGAQGQWQGSSASGGRGRQQVAGRDTEERWLQAPGGFGTTQETSLVNAPQDTQNKIEAGSHHLSLSGFIHASVHSHPELQGAPPVCRVMGELHIEPAFRELEVPGNQGVPQGGVCPQLDQGPLPTRGGWGWGEGLPICRRSFEVKCIYLVTADGPKVQALLQIPHGLILTTSLGGGIMHTPLEA